MNILGKILFALLITAMPLQAQEKSAESSTVLKLPPFRATVIQKEEVVANMAYELTIEATDEAQMEKLTPYTSRIVDAVTVAMHNLMGAAYDPDDHVSEESIAKHLATILKKVCPKNSVKNVLFTKFNIVPFEAPKDESSF